MPNNWHKRLADSKVLDFPQLESLRRLCMEIGQYRVASLSYFKHDVGFKHVPGIDKVSISSSATCVLSLEATGSWTATKAATKSLISLMLPRDTSAGLDPGNPFTAAWILESVSLLEQYSDPLDAEDLEHIAKKENVVQDAIEKGV
jgi:hypothetical protein